MLRIFLSIWHDIFHWRKDLYPVKYYNNASISKKTKGKDKSGKDMDARTDKYAEIINDYPQFNNN